MCSLIKSEILLQKTSSSQSQVVLLSMIRAMKTAPQHHTALKVNKCMNWMFVAYMRRQIKIMMCVWSSFEFNWYQHFQKADFFTTSELSQTGKYSEFSPTSFTKVFHLYTIMTTDLYLHTQTQPMNILTVCMHTHKNEGEPWIKATTHASLDDYYYYLFAPLLSLSSLPRSSRLSRHSLHSSSSSLSSSSWMISSSRRPM